MPETGRQRAIIVAASLALFGATLALLIYTEPVAPRFWFAVAITTVIASAGTLLSRRCFSQAS